MQRAADTLSGSGKELLALMNAYILDIRKTCGVPSS